MTFRRDVLFVVMLLATLAAYYPAWRGTPVWDDDGHLTRAELQTGDGLRRIWMEPGATQQYYPVTHSAFWLMHRLWGDDTLGYHVTNIVLHTCVAWLFVILLIELGVPGAPLAGLLFALHPVQVESVAWMTELKNVLSAVWYVAAAIIYVRFDRQRTRGAYVVALGLFALALLSKSVTATWPAAMLVIFWWQRGRIAWSRDVVPLLPFFVLGVGAGAFTAYVERTYIGAQGADFGLGLAARAIVAGRAVWFYAASLIWPARLSFIYPKWTIDTADVVQWLSPITAIAVVVALWVVRARTRGPLAAALLFVGALLPALGFVDVFPFRYSYVADHFQYLASMPLLAIAATGVVALCARRSGATATVLASTLLVIPCGVVTWQQAHHYIDVVTLYEQTLRTNPACWLCLNNLGERELRHTAPNLEMAQSLIERALTIQPDNAEAHNNLGVVHRLRGDVVRAAAEHRESVRALPTFADAHNNLGIDEEQSGDAASAEASYREAIRLRRDAAEPHYNLGNLLVRTGRVAAGLAELENALRIRPAYADPYVAIGNARLALGDPAAAALAYREAVRLHPAFGEAYSNLGAAEEAQGRAAEAIAAYETAVRLLPAAARPRDNLGYLMMQSGQGERAVALFRDAIRLEPRYASAYVNLGHAMLQAGRSSEAISAYEQALVLDAGPAAAQVHNNLGVALAQTGHLADAAVHFREALRLRPDFPDARRNLARAAR